MVLACSYLSVYCNFNFYCWLQYSVFPKNDRFYIFAIFRLSKMSHLVPVIALKLGRNITEVQ